MNVFESAMGTLAPMCMAELFGPVWLRAADATHHIVQSDMRAHLYRGAIAMNPRIRLMNSRKDANGSLGVAPFDVECVRTRSAFGLPVESHRSCLDCSHN